MYQFSQQKFILKFHGNFYKIILNIFIFINDGTLCLVIYVQCVPEYSKLWDKLPWVCELQSQGADGL